ncbi:MAG: CHAT domain-containing protein, partial [Sulfuritalea sp.]|nr:CHAT domain-containing protein [Sulfuritalea sp.]
MMQVQALAGDHDRQGFDCVRQELNHWLRQVARQHQDNGLAKTFVAVREDPPISICGYYALTLAELENRPDGRVGRLHVTASEWPLYDMKSDLTVLSACDTGVGRTQAGESVMGLPYALFVAGN